MKNKKQLMEDEFELARNTIPLPSILDFALSKAKNLVKVYGGDEIIIVIAMALMDLKIKDAKEKGNIKLHIKMAFC